MTSYYYLIASLPMLRADAAAALDYPEFLRQCRSSVSDSVYKRLEELSVDSDQGPFLRAWSELYQRLHAELSYQRNLRLGKPCTPPPSREAEPIVNAALNAEDPLKAEQLLLQQQFIWLDSLVGSHMFDETFLFGYAMKLRLLERQRSFQFEQGKQEFLSLLDNIQQQIFSL